MAADFMSTYPKQFRHDYPLGGNQGPAYDKRSNEYIEIIFVISYNHRLIIWINDFSEFIMEQFKILRKITARDGDLSGPFPTLSHRRLPLYLKKITSALYEMNETDIEWVFNLKLAKK